jgi:hypothetical protein
VILRIAIRRLGDPSISPRLEPAPAPLINRAGEAMVIDGRIIRENFERFMAAHLPPEE